MDKKAVMKKISASLFACLLVFGVCSFATDAVIVENEMAEDYRQVAQQGELSLWLNESTADFCVCNRADGSVWYSIPQDADEETLAAGIYRTEMSSAVSFCYYDDTGVVNNENTYAGSVMDGDFTLEPLENGFRVTYRVAKNVLSLPLRVELDDGGLSVIAETSRMKLSEDYSLESISLLPYFASAAVGEEGYFVLPQGSGALMKFKSDKTGLPAYEGRVYGTDISDEDSYLTDINQTRITLPVYGIRKNGSGMLCTVKKGASLASIAANGAGNLTSRHNIYTKFSISDNMEVQFSSSTSVIYEKPNPKLTDVGIYCMFLSGENADYSGMASAYRDHLVSLKMLKEQKVTPAPVMTVYGGIKTKKSFFGILVDSVTPLTTSEQLLELVDYAEKKGMKNPTVCMENWTADGLAGRAVTSLKPYKKLFRKYGIAELAQQKNFTFVPMCSGVLSYSRPKNLINRFTAPSSDISGVAFYKKAVSPTTFLPYGARHYFLNRKTLTKYLNKLQKAENRLETENLGIGDLCSLLYEDFGKTTMKRTDMEQTVIAAVAELAKNKKLVMNNPNAYALTYADEIINLPVTSGGHLLFDGDIPFCQLVLSGCMRYASTPMNHTDGKLALLQVLETGSMPHCFLYYEEESAVKNTDDSSLTGGYYRDNIEKLAELYRRSSEVFEMTDCGRITTHEILTGDVRTVIYENGCRVTVNYGSTDYTLPDGTVVKAMDYSMEV